jgi:hypothetical protein
MQKTAYHCVNLELGLKRTRSSHLEEYIRRPTTVLEDGNRQWIAGRISHYR